MPKNKTRPVAPAKFHGLELRNLTNLRIARMLKKHPDAKLTKKDRAKPAPKKKEEKKKCRHCGKKTLIKRGVCLLCGKKANCCEKCGKPMRLAGRHKICIHCRYITEPEPEDKLPAPILAI